MAKINGLQEKNIKQQNKKSTGILSILLLLLLVIGYFVIQSWILQKVEASQILLNDNWTILVNGVEQESNSLKDTFFPVTNIGDRVELTTTLPEQEMKRPVLQLWIFHSVIHVFVDGEQVYSYGEQLHAAGKMVGNGMHRIDLPENCAAKELRICFDVTEDNAYTAIKPIYLMSASSVYRNFLLSNLVEIVISVFLIGAGFLLAIIVIFFGHGNREYINLFYVALFSIGVAIWMLSSYCIMQMLTSNLHLIAYFEYMSLYLAPIPILLFIYHMQDNHIIRHLIVVLTSILVLFDIVVLVLNYFDIYHLSKLLAVFHALAFCVIVLIFVANIVAWRMRKQKSDHMMLCGLAILILFVFGEIVRFNIDKYINLQKIELSKSILPIGVLVFMFTLMASYVYRLVHLFYESVERKTLLQMAYTDGLTCIANRAMCEKVFDEREEEKKPTTIINFDLNHFKQVNDTYGHSCGDTLLVEFARILTDVFGADGFVGRMGGDEFIVILDETDCSVIEKMISDLYDKISVINESGVHPYQMSVACGYSSTAENTEESLLKVYKASDKKMYEHKMATR